MGPVLSRQDVDAASSPCCTQSCEWQRKAQRQPCECVQPALVCQLEVWSQPLLPQEQLPFPCSLCREALTEQQ